MEYRNISFSFQFYGILLVSILVGYFSKPVAGAMVWLFSTTITYYTPAIVKKLNKKVTDRSIEHFVSLSFITSVIVSSIFPIQSIALLISAIAICLFSFPVIILIASIKNANQTNLK